MSSSRRGTRVMPAPATIPTPTKKLRLLGCKAPKTCKCGLISNYELNVGAKQIFHKRIKIIGCWMTQDCVRRPEVEEMWQGLPWNQKHIYYSQFLDRHNRIGSMGLFPTKEGSEFNPEALREMLKDLETNSENGVPKCRCILGAKFTEPSINYYVEGNQAHPLRAISHNSTSPNSPLELEVLESKSVAQTSRKPKSSKVFPKQASSTKTTVPSPKRQPRKRKLSQTKSPESDLQEGSVKSEAFWCKLLDSTGVVHAPPKRKTLPAATGLKGTNARSLAPKVPKPKLTKRKRGAKKIAVQGIVSTPSAWAWTYEPSRDIPPGKQEEVAYLALSMVEVIYGAEEAEITEPPNKKPKIK